MLCFLRFLVAVTCAQLAMGSDNFDLLQLTEDVRRSSRPAQLKIDKDLTKPALAVSNDSIPVAAEVDQFLQADGEKYCEPWHEKGAAKEGTTAELCKSACSADDDCAVANWFPDYGDKCYLFKKGECDDDSLAESKEKGEVWAKQVFRRVDGEKYCEPWAEDGAHPKGTTAELCINACLADEVEVSKEISDNLAKGKKLIIENLTDKFYFERIKAGSFFIVALQDNPIAICLKEDGIVKPKRVFNI
jgi:hypothetical protein